MIVLENIGKTYQLKNKEPHQVLKEINLKIPPQQTLGILGYSGAGKSTLLRIMNLLVKPDCGTITIEGKNLQKLKKKELNQTRQKIGMIFQNFNLLEQLTVYENIKINLETSSYPFDSEKRIDEVLKQVGLTDKKNEYPSKLSGGQKQRVGIARAIINYPKYLLCDEITSALDQKTANEIISLLKEIKETYQMTIIFISHQIEMIRKVCDRVIVMADGEILEDRKTTQLFMNPKHPITKSLINHELETPNKTHKNLYQLIYLGNSNETILSDTIKKYQIHTNIIHAKTLEILDETLGFLSIEITGEKTKEAIKYLKENQIEVKRYE